MQQDLEGEMGKKPTRQTQRRYPPFWERAVPIVVALIGILVLGLAVVAAFVALGIFPIAG